MKPETSGVPVPEGGGRSRGNDGRLSAPGETRRVCSGVPGDTPAREKPPPRVPGSSSAARIAEVIGALPAMPHIAAQILEELSYDDTTPKEINQLITKDQALAARVLKVANSPFYGASRTIATLKDALLFMGFDSIRSLIMTAVMKSMYSRAGASEKLLWEHSVGCAAASKRIAEEIGYRPREEAYLAGLMHDVGKAALLWHAPGLMREIIKDVSNEGLDFSETEQLRFGFSHAQIGGAVANKWCFAGSIEEAIAAHHEPEPGGSWAELTRIVNAADSMCHKLAVGPVRKPDLDLNRVKSLKALGLNPELIEKILKALKDALEADSVRI